MIVREIKDRPELIATFDWFNDYKDTRSWCVQNAPDRVAALDAGMELWEAERREYWRKRYQNE